MAASNTNSPTTQTGDQSKTSSPNQSRGPNNNEDKTADASKDSNESKDSKEEKPAPAVKQPEGADNKEGASTTNAPLAPPPKPSQNGGEGGDYFSNGSKPTHFSNEPNPFENAFGSNPSDTPGKPQLPGVTSLTSPASLLPGSHTPGWPGSLRSGPLSPAMLTGPTNSNDYFSSDHHFSGSFPTPNESSLRTGLTPGGGGSMFPQPSPNSQALYNSLQSGGATPGTLDFHRTAMTARASQASNFGLPQATSQPQQNPNIQPDLDSKPYNPNSQAQQSEAQDPFSSHQTNDAANGLFMLAQAGGQQQQQQQQQRNGQQNFSMGPQQQQQGFAGGQQEQTANHRANKNSVASNISGDTENGEGEYSDAQDDTKPAARATRGKKGGSTGKGAAANGKRKTEETPSKPNNKRQRTNASNMSMDMDMEDDDDDETKMEDSHPDGKKMTDEEKRKNFLERNRVAALKCRQRKKQWLANLQQKVEIFSTENDALAATVTQLREEIVGLKTLLLAHKDCPVSAAQGISSAAIQQIAGTDNGHQYGNPYGMMGHGQMGQMGQMQRR